MRDRRGLTSFLHATATGPDPSPFCWRATDATALSWSARETSPWRPSSAPRPSGDCTRSASQSSREPRSSWATAHRGRVALGGAHSPDRPLRPSVQLADRHRAGLLGPGPGVGKNRTRPTFRSGHHTRWRAAGAVGGRGDHALEVLLVEGLGAARRAAAPGRGRRRGRPPPGLRAVQPAGENATSRASGRQWRRTTGLWPPRRGDEHLLYHCCASTS